jgi:capsular polysaccharide biosynthesis protein
VWHDTAFMTDVPASSAAPAAGNVSAAADTVAVVRKLLWIPALLAILCGVLAYAVTSGREYSAQALVKLGTQNLDQQLLGLSNDNANSNLIIAETVANLDQLRTARAAVGLLAGSPPLTPTELDKKVEVSIDTKTFLISVAATDASPFNAQKIANAYVQAYIEIIAKSDYDRLTEIEAQLRRRLAELKQQQEEALSGLSSKDRDSAERLLSIQPAAEVTQVQSKLEQLTILKRLQSQSVSFARQADVPTSPSGLPPLLFVIVGLFAGGVIGAALAFLIAGRDSRVRAEETAEGLLGAPILVRAPASLATSERERTPFSRLRPVEAESARVAAAQLRLNPTSRDARAIAVVSADDSTNGAAVALQVAGALARTPFTVLLVSTGSESTWDRVQRLLDGAPDGAGALEEEDGGDGTLHRLTVSEVELRDDRVAALRSWALQRYDRLVIASPTPDRHAAGVVLLRAADTAITVVASGKTSRPSLTRLRDLARQIGVPIAGTIATGFGSAED